MWVLKRGIVYGSWNEILYMGLETRYCIWIFYVGSLFIFYKGVFCMVI